MKQKRSAMEAKEWAVHGEGNESEPVCKSPAGNGVQEKVKTTAEKDTKVPASLKYYDNYVPSNRPNPKSTRKGESKNIDFDRRSDFECSTSVNRLDTSINNFVETEKYIKLGNRYGELKSKVLAMESENEYKNKLKLDQLKFQIKSL